MSKNKEKTYWPHMIVGFIFIGITLGYWTVKHAAALPVQKSNDFMMEYQDADINYNAIVQKRAAFDKRYRITLVDKQREVINTDIHSKVTHPPSVLLHKGVNNFRFRITDTQGNALSGAEVSFLLTRPHTRQDDQRFDKVPYENGYYVIKDVKIEKPGRYELQLRAKVDDAHIGYYKEPAYLKP